MFQNKRIGTATIILLAALFCVPFYAAYLVFDGQIMQMYSWMAQLAGVTFALPGLSEYMNTRCVPNATVDIDVYKKFIMGGGLIAINSTVLLVKGFGIFF